VSRTVIASVAQRGDRTDARTRAICGEATGTERRQSGGGRTFDSLPLVLLLLACPLPAAPPTLKVPETVTGKAGAFIAIEAESDSPWVNFKASDGLNVFPPGLLASRRATVVTGPVGTYRVWAYAGNDDGGVDREIVVTIGTPPKPEPPGPGPEPPKPKPEPPVVSVPDELRPAVSALRDHAAMRAKLAKFYADFAAVVQASDLKSTGQFANAHAAALKSFVAASGYSAPKVGQYIDAYLAECLGGLQDKPLNIETKGYLVAALKTVSEVLR
jgi:hypothetical protein